MTARPSPATDDRAALDAMLRRRGRRWYEDRQRARRERPPKVKRQLELFR